MSKLRRGRNLGSWYRLHFADICISGWTPVFTLYSTFRSQTNPNPGFLERIPLINESCPNMFPINHPPLINPITLMTLLLQEYRHTPLSVPEARRSKAINLSILSSFIPPILPASHHSLSSTLKYSLFLSLFPTSNSLNHLPYRGYIYFL